MRRAIDWNRVHEKLFGRPIGQPERPEQALIRRFAEDFSRAVLKQSSPFVRQVAVEAGKAGLAPQWLPYVFYTLMEAQESWPTMSKGMTRALAIGRDIMKETGAAPSYRGSLQLPPVEAEEAVTKALVGLATWCYSGMTLAIGRDFQKLLKKYEREAARVGENVPEGQEAVYLRVMLTHALDENHTRYPNGYILWRIMHWLL